MWWCAIIISNEFSFSYFFATAQSLCIKCIVHCCCSNVTIPICYLLCAFVVAPHILFFACIRNRGGYVLCTPTSQQTRDRIRKECRKKARNTWLYVAHQLRLRNAISCIIWVGDSRGAAPLRFGCADEKRNVLFLLWVYLMAFAPHSLSLSTFLFFSSLVFISLSLSRRRIDVLFIRNMLYSFVFILRLHFIYIFVSSHNCTAIRWKRKNHICILHICMGELCLGAEAFMSVAISNGKIPIEIHSGWLFLFVLLIFSNRISHLDFIPSLSVVLGFYVAKTSNMQMLNRSLAFPCYFRFFFSLSPVFSSKNCISDLGRYSIFFGRYW